MIVIAPHLELALSGKPGSLVDQNRWLTQKLVNVTTGALNAQAELARNSIAFRRFYKDWEFYTSSPWGLAYGAYGGDDIAQRLHAHLIRNDKAMRDFHAAYKFHN